MTKTWLAAAMVVAMAGGTALWAQAEAEKPGVVEGVVVNQMTGEPLRRAEVRLMRAAGIGLAGRLGGAAGQGVGQGMGPGGGMGPGAMAGGRGGAIGMALAAGGGGLAVLTDDMGRFRFEAVPAGDYRVMSTRAGFTAARRAGGAQVISVKAGGRVSDVRYPMLPQGVLAGKVVDEEGEPVMGAQVQVLNARRIRGVLGFVGLRGTVTNDLGEFRIAGVPPGRVMLQITPPGMNRAVPPVSGQGQAEERERGYVATYYPGVTDMSQAERLEIKPGMEMTNLDIRMRKAEVYRVTGRALEATGEPLQRFFVMASRLDQMGVGPMTSAGSVRQDGTFEMANLPAGEYRVVVRRAAAGPQNQAMGSAVVTIGSADVEGLVVQLSEGFAVKGVVEVVGKSATGAVMSPRNMRVMLQPAEAGAMMMGVRPGTPGEDGSFTVEGVTPGRYRVPLMSMGGGMYLDQVLMGGQDYYGKVLDLTGGAPGPLRLVYRTDGGKVQGTVEGLEDKPMTPPMAVMLPADAELREQAQPVVATVDEAGGFQFQNLRAGEYLLWVFDDVDLAGLADEDLVGGLVEKAVKVRVEAGRTGTAKARVTAWPLEY